MQKAELTRKLTEIIQQNSEVTTWTVSTPHLLMLVDEAVKAERAALERELLKLGKGVAANSDYIQGRWDLIGEFQDIIRARGQQ